MKCSIMQPTYLPWAGYFNLISNVDHFVFLDDAQYSKGSFHNRNKYLSNGEAKWITVPVLKRHHRQALNESLVVEESNWRRKHLTLLQTNYGKLPFYVDAIDIIEPVLSDEKNSTIDLINTKLIEGFTRALRLPSVQFHCASRLGLSGDRSHRILKICEMLGCQHYLSPQGAQAYIEDDDVLPDSDALHVEYQEFECLPYPQGTSDGEFVPYMSIVDVVCNVGLQAAATVVRDGFRSQIP